MKRRKRLHLQSNSSALNSIQNETEAPSSKTETCIRKSGANCDTGLLFPPSPSATPPWKTKCDNHDPSGENDFNFGQEYESLEDRIKVLGTRSQFEFFLDSLPRLIPPNILSSLIILLRKKLYVDIFTQLPQELSFKIASFLDTESLLSARLVNSRWRNLLDNMGTIWEQHWKSYSQSFDIDCANIETSPSPLNKLLSARSLRQSWFFGEAHRIDIPCHLGSVITCLQMLPNHRIASASDDGTIQIWCSFTGERIFSLLGHSGGVWAIHSIDNVLLSGSTDRSLRLWCLDSGRCLGVLKGHSSTVRCVSLAYVNDSNGKPMLAISGSRDSTLRVWSLDSMSTRNILSGHTAAVRCLAIDGEIVVSGSYDGTARVWNLSNGTCLHTLVGHVAKIYSIAILGSTVATGSMDSNIFVWNVISGECMFVLEGHRGIIGSLSFIDSGRIVSSNTDGSVRIWNIEKKGGECIHRLRMDNNMAVTFLQANRSIIVAGADRILRLWETSSGKFIRDLLTDVDTIWRLAFDDRVCVAGCQKLGVTTLSILQFGENKK